METNEKIANMFTNGIENGKSLNMFIEGKTIYSYGFHFPISKKIKINNNTYLYLFNNNGYSNTTEKHKSLVLRELKNLNNNIILIGDCNLDNIKPQIKQNNEKIQENNIKIKRTRTERTFNFYKENTKDLKEQNKFLKDLSLLMELETE